MSSVATQSSALERFAADCRALLDADPGPRGRERIRDRMRELLLDEDFVTTHLGPDNHSQRKLLHKDSKHGFCIFAHVYEGAKASRPHDHGPSWAIYGQAVGETMMTDWRIVEEAELDAKAGKVEAARNYKLAPGDAHLYNEGDVHSPARTGETRLVRIEGVNMDGVPRRWYDPA